MAKQIAEYQYRIGVLKTCREDKICAGCGVVIPAKTELIAIQEFHCIRHHGNWWDALHYCKSCGLPKEVPDTQIRGAVDKLVKVFDEPKKMEKSGKLGILDEETGEIHWLVTE